MPSKLRVEELQEELGDLGTVLPRQMRGTHERRAQGWYAELVDGRTVFLGDTTAIALRYIDKLRENATTGGAAPA